MSQFLLETNGGDIATENLNSQVALIEALRQSRIDSGISLDEAAHTLGISVSLLEAVEGFRVDLSMTDLRQYAYACNAVIEYSVS